MLQELNLETVVGKSGKYRIGLQFVDADAFLLAARDLRSPIGFLILVVSHEGTVLAMQAAANRSEAEEIFANCGVV